MMFMVFIALEKAYDNVCREKLWRTLFKYGIRGRRLRGWSRSGLGCAKE